MIYIDDVQQIPVDDTVFGFLTRAQVTPFVIPEFQRPYTWSEKEVDKLFEDIWDFSQEVGGFQDDSERYFLGAFVGYFENISERSLGYENRKQGDGNIIDEQTEKRSYKVLNIIDGQQRVTTIFLLLRAIYKHLEDQQSDVARELRHKIEKVIWKIVDKKTKKVDRKIPLIQSFVIDEEKRAVFTNILITGKAERGANDAYSRNYRYIENKLESFLSHKSYDIDAFYEALLNQTFFLPVVASKLETALRVFNTLNNRGLALTDADVFKAMLYGYAYEKGMQDQFIQQWNELTQVAEKAEITTQSLFSYYMFYLKAKSSNARKTGNIAIRDFYSSKTDRLTDPSLMINLRKIADLFFFVNKRQCIGNCKWCGNLEIQKTLDILRCFESDYWKYPVICFYLTHEEDENFEFRFLKFLKALLSVLVLRFIIWSNVNSIKSVVLNIDAEACTTITPNLNFDLPNRDEFQAKVPTPHYKLIRLLLRLVAYLDDNQKGLLPEVLQVEHILPQNYSSISDEPKEKVDEFMEHLGNKIPLEEIPNIKASDKWFKLKKEYYLKDSKVALAHTLANSSIQSWTTDQIADRDKELQNELWEYFQSCLEEYNRKSDDSVKFDIEEYNDLKAKLAKMERMLASKSKFATGNS